MSERQRDESTLATYAEQDALARKLALDVTRSWLVQAPAGSGKTELLIQRFLALLARVDRPERIVAMTFTRKAAGEMRERIVAALRDAACNARVMSHHEQKTRDLANSALAQDRRHDWQLAAYPARLQVQTIDALCAALARQAPLATGLGGSPRFSDEPYSLYVRAARDALAAARSDDRSWSSLLAHLDNNAAHAIELLAGMLSTRDQWLREIIPEEPEGLRTRLEATLSAEIEGVLVMVKDRFPAELSAALVPLARHAVANVASSPDNAALAQALEICVQQGGLPPATVAALEHWRHLARWLLRSGNNTFLKMVNTRHGFPAGRTALGIDNRGAKLAMHVFLAELTDVPGLAAMLDVVRRLPPPCYSDESWRIVESLLAVLPQVAAQLTLTFRDNGAIDFTHGMLAALSALGRSDEPGELLLRMDFVLEHLLIDEFQDISYSQLDLIRRLTAGWQPGDGRSLFAVGDPMQSIYKFRQAEVRLFIEAQNDRRIGDVPIDTLLLRRNFRSQAALVEWSNSIFPDVLGSYSDPWRGVVAFEAAAPVLPALAGPAATIDVVSDARDEARMVVEKIRADQAAGARSIAVLVRARPHADALLPALRAAGIAYAAVELERLAERPVVLDLLSLTRAITQPADKLAWLAVLRAPWCGLTLADLFALVAPMDKAALASLGDVIASDATLARLSEDGRARLRRVAAILAATLESKGRAPLWARVRGAWLAIGGPACCAESIDIDVAERFFRLLAAHETAGELADQEAFVQALSRLHVESAIDGSEQRNVQVMTLHRAKGLEFDSVIIPGIGHAPERGGSALLRWRRRSNGLMLAPIRSQLAEDPVYRYLGFIHGDEEDAELGRLLYVGCTRAKQRLHLVGCLRTIEDKEGHPAWASPLAGSLLARLCSAWANAAAPPPRPNGSINIPPRASPSLSRLPRGWTPSRPVSWLAKRSQPSLIAGGERPAFDWARETSKHVGTVAHRVLAQIAVEGLTRWPLERIDALSDRILVELAAEGVDAIELAAAVRQVQSALRNVLADPRGRWLFDPSHIDARSEYAITAVHSEALVNVVLDRTFVANGVRWIVDFKLSRHEGSGVDLFLDNERHRYRDQLEAYARVMRSLDSRPIRLGLYFPMHAGWREWESNSLTN